VEQIGLPHAGSDAADHVTISVGAATVIATPDNDVAQLVAAADAALYRAKNEGRNRVVAVETAVRKAD
jgi:two-component system chemotaxis family response regulator WspR